MKQINKRLTGKRNNGNTKKHTERRLSEKQHKMKSIVQKELWYEI